MDKSKKPFMADEQVENLIRRSLTDRMGKEPERYGTFLAIQDRLTEKSNSRLIQLLLDSLGFRWRVTSMFRKRIAQGAAFASIAAVLVAYVAFLGADTGDDSSTGAVADGGSEPTAESKSEVTEDETTKDDVVEYPTIGAPPENIVLDVLDPRPMRNDLIDSSILSDTELARAWTGYIVASRLIFDDGVSGFQDWRFCGNKRGVVVGDHSGRNPGQYFSWELDVDSSVAKLGIDLDIENRSALLVNSESEDTEWIELIVNDGVMMFDLGLADLVQVGVMDALEEADRCPEYAPGPPTSGHDLERDQSPEPLGTAEPPK
ncbi:hypothetical protein [Candidatus Lucifugimonas marina]|uniref:Uncharacterized protein n=1 Tax=Candidatus Lucifugimonas marina TaxID=3038979 RepID=A0AAJ6CRP3_9CHLR|nr:hypothetical protein [SAR202 cluster bacterium JH702]MDG0868866.1 hypothetical protein [SAR202 cluster bacterium JH639]WFG35494.1 hypothetical protein GKN94_07240 [SAR202 cluster bacterium JH545]WFG39441.1 hypothetical protein GKO48_07355 [SAR202 cluster bacterium JH1073]